MRYLVNSALRCTVKSTFLTLRPGHRANCKLRCEGHHAPISPTDSMPPVFTGIANEESGKTLLLIGPIGERISAKVAVFFRCGPHDAAMSHSVLLWAVRTE